MDGSHPENIDPRPKRRKSRDNPYTIFTVGIDTDTPRYYISFIDSQGINVCTETSKELFDLLNQFELEDLSYFNEVDNHYEQSELLEGTMENRMLYQRESLEDTVLRQDEYSRIHKAIAMLPLIQQRRLRMYYFEGMKYGEIARLEGCTLQAVAKSVTAAEKKIKYILSGG